jgi:hypothetical protein
MDKKAEEAMYERAMGESLAAMIAGRHKRESRAVDRVILAVDLFEYLGIHIGSYHRHLRDYKLAKECGDRVLRRSGLHRDREGWYILPPLTC